MKTNIYLAALRKYSFLPEGLLNILKNAAGNLTEEERGKVIGILGDTEKSYIAELHRLLSEVMDLEQEARRILRTSAEDADRISEQLPTFNNGNQKL